MNKRGFTVVELTVSVSIIAVVVVFLIQIIVNLTNMYSENGIKTNLLNKQGIISRKINDDLINKELNSITNCGTNCYNLIYKTGEQKKLKIENDILTYDNYATKLDNASFKTINLDIIYAPTVQQDINNAIFKINIPIESSLNTNFDINIIYQFNTSDSLIDEYFTN